MNQLIVTISILSGLIPIFFFLKKKSHFINTKWLFFYVLISVSFDVLGLVITYTGFPAYWLRYLVYGFFIIQFLIINIYFHKQHILSQAKTKLYIASFFFGLISYIFFLFYEDFPKFNSYGSAIFSLILIIYCILGFKKITTQSKHLYIEQSAFFWVLSGFILYFSGSFFVFTFGRYIQSQNREYFLFLWIFVHDFLNIIKNICLAVSFTRKTE